MSSNRPFAWLVAALLAPVFALGFVACSDDDGDGESGLEQTAEESAALTAAAAFKSSLLANDVDDDSNRRSIALLTDAESDIPGDPDVRGIEDSDGDGIDDDGQVEIYASDEAACVTISDTGDVDVSGGEC